MPRQRRAPVRAWCILAGAIVLATTQASLATNAGSAGTAGSGGTNNGVWWTIDANWKVAMDTLTAADQSAIANAVQTVYQPTDLNAAHTGVSTCSYPSHDVCVVDDNYGANGLNGWNACAGATSGAHPNQTCTIQLVRMNLAYPWAPAFLSCHELGHTVGLRHTSQAGSCMNDGSGNTNITPHDAAHINAHY